MSDIVHHRVTDVARAEFAQEQRDLIRQTIAPDCTQAEFDLFLELAARYGLNPLHGEIYAAKMPGRNGGPGKFTPIIGKDGMLAIANRHRDFRGIEADVVHEYDSFQKTKEGVEHTYELGSGGDQPRPADPETDQEPGLVPPLVRKRGAIVGAWAIVHRSGRVPTYFFAPWHEYSRPSSKVWKDYPDAMIRKVAVANALREAFNLSGLYTEAELPTMQATDTPGEPEAWAEDPELATRIGGLVELAQDVLPGKFRPARVRLLLATASEDERRAFANSLEEQLNVAREENEAVVDAEVVEDAA